jgi:hypothetical protein
LSQTEDQINIEYLSTDNWLFSCLPRGEQLLENLLFIIFKLGNCTNPRADYEIQLVGAVFLSYFSLATCLMQV